MKTPARKVIDPTYQLRALCAGTDPEEFFRADRDAALRDRLRITLCNACPVVSDCFWDNLFVPKGMYGGHTWRQRKEFIRQQYEIELHDRDHYFDTNLPAYDIHVRQSR